MAPSIVSANLKVTGDLESEGDIQIDGVVEGDVRSASVTVGEQATVRGSIEADKVHVAGIVNGQISGRVVELMRSAKVTGDILHESLAIEAGAFIQGLCRHVPRTEGASQSTPAISSSGDEQPPENVAPTLSPTSPSPSSVANVGAGDEGTPIPAPRPEAEEAGKSKGSFAATAAARGQEVVRKVFR